MKDLVDLIKNRRSTHCFSDKSVNHELIGKIIDTAKNCATGGNMQPWQVAIVSGKTKQKLSQRLIAVARNRTEPNPDYDYYPTEDFLPFSLRRHKAGLALYHAAGIQFDHEYIDWGGVIELVTKNYSFFGADIGLIFYLDKRLTEGANIDLGIFMQNIMLLAEHFGLGTCPQAAMANYPDIIREELAINKKMKIVCGMSIGYIDQSAGLNRANIKKESYQSFATWYY